MYCRKCGKRLIEYPELKVIEFYSETTGQPVYKNGYMRCPDNPCHQGHTFEQISRDKWYWFFLPFHIPSEKVKCKVCGEIEERYIMSSPYY